MNIPFFKRFTNKLIFSYLCIACIGCACTAYLIDTYTTQRALLTEQKQSITQAHLIAHRVRMERATTENLSAFMQALDMPREEFRGIIVNAQGKAIADSSGHLGQPAMRYGDAPDIHAAFRGEITDHIKHDVQRTIDVLYVTMPIYHNNHIVGALRVEHALLQLHTQQTHRRIMLVIVFVLVMLLVLRIARSLVRPLNTILHTSHKLSQGDLTHSILLSSDDEMNKLATTLNAMSHSLENKIKEVEVQNQRLVAILESMVEGIIVVDKDACIVGLNPSVERMFGVTQERVQGTYVLEMVRNNDMVDVINTVLKHGEYVSKECLLLWPVQKTVLVNVSPLFDAETQSLRGCVLVMHDITQLRALETMQRDFVANVSHELKTPLTAIKGFVETLLEGAYTDTQSCKQFIGIIESHTRRLESLVNDLLELSQLEADATPLHKETVSLNVLVHDVLTSFTAALTKKNITTDIAIASDVVVVADPHRLAQVCTNLIDNAIKFNKENGTITIRCTHDDATVTVFVEDSGVGIPAKDMPRIFERFYRVDKARSRELGGTGLGLSIVKHIVQLHGGTIGVESHEGFGSIFWFMLPN